MTPIYLDRCAVVWLLIFLRRKESKIKLLDSHEFLTLGKKNTYILHNIMKLNFVDVKILVQIVSIVTDLEFISIKSPVASF